MKDNLSMLLFLYLAGINLATGILFGFDKYQARRGGRRIPEARLMVLAACGGSPAAWLAMHLFHHKTRHKKFSVGIPLILLVQGVLALLCHFVFIDNLTIGQLMI